MGGKVKVFGRGGIPGRFDHMKIVKTLRGYVVGISILVWQSSSLDDGEKGCGGGCSVWWSYMNVTSL